MNKLEEALDMLTVIVNRSRSKRLKIAFANYINEHNKAMKEYVALLSTLKNISKSSRKRRSTWDHEYVKG